MTKLDEIRQDRYALVQKARVLLDTAKNEKRDMTTEENTQYDKIMADVDKMGAQVQDEEKREALSRIEAGLEKPVESAILPNTGGPVDKRSTPEYRKSFSTYLSSISKQDEARALQMNLDTAGGYTVPPQQFIAELIEALKATTVIRRLSRTFSVPDAQTLGCPSLDARPADTTWTSELKIGDEDSTMKFGTRQLTPQPLAQYIKVSKKLARASAFNIDGIVRDQLAYKVSTIEETGFMTGTGAHEPLGVFVNSSDGISSTYDVSSGNTDTQIRADGLINAKYDLRSVYWPRSRWIFHQDSILQIRKLRGNDGDFLWQPGLTADAGDRLLGLPIEVSEFAPHTFTTGSYVGIIGDFNYYWIADALDITIEVLVELFAATNQNGYVIRKETDAMPVLGEAFRRVTLA